MTLRLAIVGVGDVAQRDYLPELGRLADRVEVVVACSRGAERARDVAERFGIPRWTMSYHEAVSADDVDAVANLTPFSLHDLHLLDVVAAARVSAAERAAASVQSSFAPLDLRLEAPSRVEHLHDHTRPSDEQ